MSTTFRQDRTPIGMQPPRTRYNMAEDGAIPPAPAAGASESMTTTTTKRARNGGQRQSVTISTTAEIGDGVHRARAVERLVGPLHWTVAAAALLLLRTDCSHGHIEEHFDKRLEWLWHWLTKCDSNAFATLELCP